MTQGEQVSTWASGIRAAWREIAPNYDSALAHVPAREFLLDGQLADFERVPLEEALAYRESEFPEFFQQYDYAWCRQREHYDFPIEAAYQVRALDAAIGLWTSPLADKPRPLELGRIVARSTYLAKFDHATPRTKSNRGIDFLICPLGFIEFMHRFFAAFGGVWNVETGLSADWRTQCHSAWQAIAVNMIASSEAEVDYFLPSMMAAVVAEVPAFASALLSASEVRDTTVSADLARSAQDFAICHELAHIVARDEALPNETRADRWGMAAYVGSWPLQLGVHLDIANADELRVAIGPIAFALALQSLLSTRVHVSRASGEPPTVVERRLRVLGAGLERARALLAYADSGVTDFASHRAVPADEWRRWRGLLIALGEYGAGFATALSALSPDACSAARAAARHAHDRELTS